MSKFLLNLLLQISKALLYSKIKFLFRKEFSFTFGPIGPAASRPSHGPLVFFQPTAPPLPTGPQPLGRPSRPARGSASSRAAFTPLRTRLTGGPHLSSLTSGSARVRPRRHRLPPLQPRRPAPHLGMPPEPLPPHHHSPLILPPPNLASVFNGVNSINAAVTPPGHPSPALPRPL